MTITIPMVVFAVMCVLSVVGLIALILDWWRWVNDVD